MKTRETDPLERAIAVIASYQMDIRTSELDLTGFCAGAFYRDALSDIRAMDYPRALAYAIKVIESYQFDIRNSRAAGVDADLAEIGFCQGSIYTGALDAIQRLRSATPSP